MSEPVGSGRNNPSRKMILEDGSVYYGYGFGSGGKRKLELVFNTSMVGYQEIISDPSYTDQAIVMTYPVIGNYGINRDDFESGIPGNEGVEGIAGPGALIVRDYTDVPSNFRCGMTLSGHMAERGIAGIYGVDTREITRRIRDYGSCKVMITDASDDDEKCQDELREWTYATDQVSRVSTPQIREFAAESGELYHVVAIDCGIKSNIIRSLNSLGCRVTLVPYDTSADKIEELKPDGVFISNGPGDPTDVEATIQTVRSLHGKYPIFGICLGHQILSLSYGAST
ncbi:MAG: carbamoyl phosphate synthase small subunit, partial [Lachnospiraceae bacterium]|nr:carbamoyl phosphate synthase small subunit [Lachnospiraceae bacterium]